MTSGPPISARHVLWLTVLTTSAWLHLPLPAAAAAEPLPAAGLPIWQSLGPWGGSVPVLAIGPRDPAVLWAGTRDGGLFRSPDLGRTWQPRNQGLGEPWISAIALDPFNPNRLWVTTISGGLYRSGDAGGHWRRLGSGLPPPQADFVLLADPARRNWVFGLHGMSLYRSQDAGATWHLARNGVSAVTFDAAGTLYLGRGPDVLRSSDGRTFRRVSSSPTGMTRVSVLAVHHRRPRELWVGDGPLVWRSLDGGATWTEQGQPATVAIRRLVPHSRLAGVLYAVAGNKLWKSVDAGATWTQLALDATGKASVATLAVDARTPGRLVVGLWALQHPGGVFVGIGAGAHFRSISAGGPALAVGDFAVDPRDPRRIAAVAGFVGVLLTKDGGVNWELASSEVVAGIPPFPSDVAFDPLVDGRLYVLDANGLARSDDGGATWSVSPLPAGLCTCVWLEPDPVVADRLYAGGYGGLVRSDDAGASWTALQGYHIPSLVYDAFRFLVDPADPGHLFVLGFVPTGGNPRLPVYEPRLIESADAGASWVRSDETLPAPPVAIAADPVDFDRPWVATERALYRAGGSGDWQLVSDALSLFDLRAGADGVLLGLGTALPALPPPARTHSLWMSPDGGATWVDLRAELAFRPYRLERVGDRVIVTAGGGLHARLLPGGYSEP